MEDNSVIRLMEARRKAVGERARLDNDIAAIDRVLELLEVSGDEFQDSKAEIGEAPESIPEAQDSVPSPTQKAERPPSQNGRSQKIKITQEVRNVVQETEGEFDAQDVVRWIKEKHPSAEVRPGTVSSTLWRMANEWGTIEKVREGYGSEPHTYRKVSHDGPAQEGFPDEEHASDEGAIVNERALMSE